MAALRAGLSITSIILLAGGIVLQFFVILSGVVNNSAPVNLVYFLQASTAGITSSTVSRIPANARWTFFALCGEANGHNANCHQVHPAFPFNPPGRENFGTIRGIPSQFIGTDRYYYLSRFAFAFFLIALFFAVVSFFLSAFALCARLGAYLTGLTTMLALFFQIVAASLITAWSVLGRDAFRKNGQSAKLGAYGYGFTWAAAACFLLSTILFCVGGRADKSSGGGGGRSGGYFGRKRSTRSRGSFVDSESGRRVKDEYE
ncbi:SUR7/PalI family-domain-containing protein [Neohortaea acidophila]|uniref:SUR7/PalI family-domain-containing protein n=1 Tax=Neohortaea acidophila TaxID=245834 RepID=A0A6A6Q3L0_9PEZI|nr:SUR7/PalI family-domain-containing protein [Neohortaea acidophila]KAF2486007.1 SUR7/PalI family-domain-containing protein [Neohortaea acidophila]